MATAMVECLLDKVLGTPVVGEGFKLGHMLANLVWKRVSTGSIVELIRTMPYSTPSCDLSGYFHGWAMSMPARIIRLCIIDWHVVSSSSVNKLSYLPVSPATVGHRPTHPGRCKLRQW